MKKRAMSLALAVMLTLGLCSCGGGEKNTSSDGKIVITVGGAPNKEATPKDYEDLMEDIAEFNKIRPDVEVKLDEWKYDIATFMPKAEAGLLPSIYETHFTEAKKIIDLGYACDVTKQLKERGFYERTNESILDTITRDGKVYFVPKGVYTLGLLLNLDLFEKAGLMQEDGTPIVPQTFDELAETAKLITEKTGAAGFLFPTTENFGGWYFTVLGWNFGAEFMKQDADGKWKSTFANEQTEAALKYLQDLKWNGGCMPANTLINNAEAMKQMALGNAAMCFANPSQVNSLVRTYGMDMNKIGFAKMPGHDGRRITLMGGSFISLSPDLTEEQKEAVFDWIEFKGTTFEMTDELKAKMRKNIERSRGEGLSLIGLQDLSIWTEETEVQKYNEELKKEFCNVNYNHIKLFNDKSGIEYQVEEPMCAQDLYGILDSCLQEVLTNEGADCAQVLKKAANDFQLNFLDYQN